MFDHLYCNPLELELEGFYRCKATSMHFSLYRLPFGTYIRLPTSNIQSRMA